MSVSKVLRVKVDLAKCKLTRVELNEEFAAFEAEWFGDSSYFVPVEYEEEMNTFLKDIEITEQSKESLWPPKVSLIAFDLKDELFRTVDSDLIIQRTELGYIAVVGRFHPATGKLMLVNPEAQALARKSNFIVMPSSTQEED